MMRILVTGGAGFIGSHLCEALLEHGHHVTCVDDLSSGSRENIRHLEDCDEFVFSEFNVENEMFAQVDRIFHLACPASPVQYQKEPVRTMMTCVLGTKNTLDLAQKAGARILLASTSEVYGDPEIHPQPETYKGCVDSLGPRGCYTEGKRAAESLMMDYRRQNQTDTRIARIFNTYGPHMAEDDGRVMPEFVARALHGQSLLIHGNGAQTRSFCYVGDLVEGLVRLMECEGTGASEPINLGRPEEISIIELARIINRLVQNARHSQLTGRPENDPERRCPDISRAAVRLGWVPSTSLEEGLAKTIDWFAGRIRKEDVA